MENARAEYIAAGCPGCQMQLNVGVRRRGLNVKVVHPVELLDRAYSRKEQ
jgi:glycolate oxidase iron-sulfur subunit